MSSKSTNKIHVGNCQPQSSQHQEISVELSDILQNDNTYNQDPLGITEVIIECQKGNFEPALQCLRDNRMPKDFLDENGYSVFHYAVSQGSIPAVSTLLNDFKFDVNFRSQSKQTPLMIACNFGYIEIVRILIGRGAQVNATDNTGFSPLLYSVKQGSIPQIAYLLHHQADAATHDVNGCTVIHWAAYRNHMFMLELFKRLGFDLNGRDAAGLTPLERAVQNHFCEPVKYLLKNGDGKMPRSLEYDKVISPQCKELLRKQYFPTKFEKLRDEYWGIFVKHSQKITFGVYVFLWFFMMTIYIKAAMNKVSDGIWEMIFFLFSIFYIGYSFWYFLRSSQLKTKGYQKLNKTSDNPDNIAESRENIPVFNSDALDKLVKGDSHGTVIHEGESDEPISFLHELAWNFETKNYEAIAKFKENDYCPKCLQKKPERSHHPENSGACVPHFHHYSYTLGRSIDRNNHYLHLILLLSKLLLYKMFFSHLIDAYSGRLEHSFLSVLGVGFNLFEDFGLMYSSIYMMLLILAARNWVLATVEMMLIGANITEHEMLNFKTCSYLWEEKRGSSGRTVLSFNNKNSLGLFSNIKQYIKRIFH